MFAESALAGLATDATVRGPAWRFLDIGRRLERAILLLGVVEATLAPAAAPEAGQPLLRDGAQRHARASSSTGGGTAATWPSTPCSTSSWPTTPIPRSLAFQLDRLTEDLAALPLHADRERHAGRVDDVGARRVRGGVARRRSRRPRAGRRLAVDRVVLDARGPLLELAEAFSTRWFADQGDGRRFRRGAG